MTGEQASSTLEDLCKEGAGAAAAALINERQS